MSSTPANTESSFLRAALFPPRPGQFHAMHPGNLDPARLDAFIADVWNDLTLRFRNPLRAEDDAAVHRIYFIDTICYAIDRKTGHIEITALDRTDSGFDFLPKNYLVAVDLPLITTGGWLESYLKRWWERMGEVMIDHQKTGAGESWLGTVKRVFWRAIQRSTAWNRLRYALREALALDPKILSWSRHGRSRNAWRHVTDDLYNRTVAHRENYAQLERDNPDLIWLYTFLLDERAELPKGEVVAAMRTYLGSRKISPAGWRLLANGSEKDFRHIRDWIGPAGELTGRLHELPDWLRLVTALRRKRPFGPAILRLFLHDSFKTDKEGLVRFRNVWIQVPVLKLILDEAERRLGRGSLQSFANEDLVEVMTWLEAEQPVFDKNQIKSGWKHLTGRAVQWKVETEVAQNLGGLAWRSVLAATTIGAWTIVPLDDAWQLRQEALRQHHCADRYLNECLAGDLRLFSVRNGKERPVATIGLELKRDTWRSFGIRLSCNRPVGPGLVGLDAELAHRYTELWRLAQPVPPAWPERVVRDDPVYFDSLEEASCPICGGEGVYCPDHTVACYDIAETILIGGSIDDAIEKMEETARAIIAAAIRSDIRSIGLGDDFDVILGYVRDDMDSMESLEAAIDNWSRKIRIALYDSALDHPEVCHTIADSDGGMPGLSSSYRSYWAADPDWVVARLEERLGAVRDWLAGLNESVDADNVTDEAVLSSHENRLGIEVDRNDPMLPAVIAMERALMKMFDDERSTRSGD